ncbi:hypothetical protein BT69DRAFT_1306259 [Atractiella rhizophila]|nr:hypothetical protein BT69DRAFT_1306259 [Atractiella rhizophila]
MATIGISFDPEGAPGQKEASRTQAAEPVPPRRRNSREGLEEDVSTSTRSRKHWWKPSVTTSLKTTFNHGFGSGRCPKDTVSWNRSAFDPWVEACHLAERRVGELQREVDKLKMEKDVLEEETRALVSLNVPTKSCPPPHDRPFVSSLHHPAPIKPFGPGPSPSTSIRQSTQPQKRPREEDGETKLIQLAKDRSAAMKDRSNMLFD